MPNEITGTSTTKSNRTGLLVTSVIMPVITDHILVRTVDKSVNNAAIGDTGSIIEPFPFF